MKTYFEIPSKEPHSALIEFAGILSEKDADDMLEAIYTGRIDSDKSILGPEG